MLIGDGKGFLISLGYSCKVFFCFRVRAYVKHTFSVKAESETIQEGIDEDSSDESGSEGLDEDGKKKKKKDKVGFRDRKVRADLTN